jgi:hypothetical protein
MKTNARFWIFHRDAWVKVTLHPGQQITFGFYEKTDEGFTRQVTNLCHDGAAIVREWLDRGRDCDGLVETRGRDFCPLSALQGRTVDGLNVPDWREAAPVEIYDEFARAANY